jgi:hypothetical protein
MQRKQVRCGLFPHTYFLDHAQGSVSARGLATLHCLLGCFTRKDQAERGKATSGLSVSTIALANRLIPAGSVIRWL